MLRVVKELSAPAHQRGAESKIMPTDLKDLITQAEAARIRGVSREAIYDLVGRGKLKVVEIGGQKFVRRSDVENYEAGAGGRPAGQSVKAKTRKTATRKK
jgi:excisionase family DNA binding protein